jgi:hypothetical protein
LRCAGAPGIEHRAEVWSWGRFLQGFQPAQIACHNPGLIGLKLLFVCRLNAKRPRGFPAGAIPTVDFLLHHTTAFVKKMPVKSHDGAGSKFSQDWIACLSGFRSRRSLRSSQTQSARAASRRAQFKLWIFS